MTDPDELLQRAREVREHAHAPYSGFRVGAAVRAASGRVYVGCNVENASYGATVCAERSAVFAMVAAGETALVEVAIFTHGDAPAMPCGMCRQVLSEFGTDVVVRSATPGESTESTLTELLPHPFRFVP
jgi:cytidine deaminase